MCLWKNVNPNAIEHHKPTFSSIVHAVGLLAKKQAIKNLHNNTHTHTCAELHKKCTHTHNRHVHMLMAIIFMCNITFVWPLIYHVCIIHNMHTHSHMCTHIQSISALLKPPTSSRYIRNILKRPTLQLHVTSTRPMHQCTWQRTEYKTT